MTTTGIVWVLALLAVAVLSLATVVVTARGGRGPGDPPASHRRTDPAGFPVLPAPRGVLHRRVPRPAGWQSRRGVRQSGPQTAAVAAASVGA